MFERITLDRRDVPGAPIDLGLLAQCLTFYKTTRIIADQVTFPYLVRSCGAEEVLHLVSMGTLEIEYFENLSGIISRQVDGELLHDYGNITSQSLKYPAVARKLFDQLAGPSGKGAVRQYNKFERIVKRSEYTGDMIKEGIRDWTEEAYMTEAARALLRMLAPSYRIPEPLQFRVSHGNQGFRISSNIDFDLADQAYRLKTGTQEKTITPAFFLAQISNARRDMIVGSQFGSEFALGAQQTLVTSCKFAQIIMTAQKGLNISDVFQEEAVDGLPSIREIINSGEKNFSDVVKLVEKADRFKKWLTDQGATEDIRKEYLHEVSHIDWADRLPPKSLRWLLITGAGLLLGASSHPLVGTVVGTAMSAADTLLLDKFIKGWKPNQFVEGPLRQFLQP